MADPASLRWDVRGVPNLFLLDRSGLVQAVDLATPDAATLEAAVSALVAEAEAAR